MSLSNILGNGYSGLQAAQQALNVIAQNISNSDTEGYSRQRVDLAAVQTTPDPGLYTGHGVQFNGVTVATIERIKNNFLQAAASSALGKQSALQSQTDPLTDVQGLLNEPSDNGLQSAMDTFYKDWAALGNSPDSQAAGNVVIQDGVTLAGQLNQLSNGTEREWTNQLSNLSSVVSQVNVAAGQVASLNAEIKQGQVGGDNVNALMDERDKAVTTLTSLVGGQPATGLDGQISVSVSGVSLVSGGLVANQMTLGGAGDIESSPGNPPTLSIGTTTTNPSSGSAAGLLSSLRTDLPGIYGQLDGIATALQTAVNAASSSGYTLSGVAGADFFTGTGAKGIAVVSTSYADLAVSSSAGAVDGSNASKIGDFTNDAIISAALGGAPGPSELYRGMTTGLATKISGLNTAITGQTAIVATAQNAVDSDSGVDVNEELTNMLLYQRSYQASAKVISTADQMMQTLIGMVS